MRTWLRQHGIGAAMPRRSDQLARAGRRADRFGGSVFLRANCSHLDTMTSQ
jgi:hypothetical protein